MQLLVEEEELRKIIALHVNQATGMQINESEIAFQEEVSESGDDEIVARVQLDLNQRIASKT